MNSSNNEDHKGCRCCGRKRIGGFNMKSDVLEFSVLGAAYPLYFYFVRRILLLLIAILLVSGIFNIASN